jgi:arylsulfatase A-like enzyme
MPRCLPILAYLLLPALLTACAPPASPPNIVIIFADDLGYGDLGVYGHPTIHTPHLDRMAAEGMKFTQFYAAASVCTPSRAGLLTGRLPVRSGMAGETRHVLFPDSKLGLPAEEITIAEALRERGYATAAIGKWHLGHLPPYLPTANGFDYYFGIPYSNDMDRVVGGEWQDPFWEPKSEYWNVPLLRNDEVVERPADQTTLTRRYTEEAIQFIQEHRDGPFFVYLAHTMPHVPLFTSDAFADTSRRGLYGDVIEELDWSVGQVLNTLRQEGLAENTLVFFTSDNGPWLVFDSHGGSAGLLRGGKGMTWEGGMREPSLAWWPGTIAPGQVSASLTSTMDYFATALELAGQEIPNDRVIDGRSLLPILQSNPDREIRDTYFFYRGTILQAVRKGSWKAHFITQWEYEADNQRVEHNPPLLFNLDEDPSEQFDVSAAHPDILSEIADEVVRHKAGMVARPTQLEERIESE